MRIAVIAGDGIGRDVTAEAVKILERVSAVYGRPIALEHLPWGADHYLATGETLPANGYALLREFDAVFVGALGDPRVPDNRHAREILLGTRFELDLPFDLRNCDWSPTDREGPLPPYQRIWLKATGVLPDDPVLHACALTYASDMTLLDTALLPHGLGPIDNVFMASLDHAMWFHRPFRADEWLLYSQDTPTASEGRGLGRGLIFTADGRLAVSVVQEGLIRVSRP